MHCEPSEAHAHIPTERWRARHRPDRPSIASGATARAARRSSPARRWGAAVLPARRGQPTPRTADAVDTRRRGQQTRCAPLERPHPAADGAAGANGARASASAASTSTSTKQLRPPRCSLRCCEQWLLDGRCPASALLPGGALQSAPTRFSVGVCESSVNSSPRHAHILVVSAEGADAFLLCSNPCPCRVLERPLRASAAWRAGGERLALRSGARSRRPSGGGGGGGAA